MSVIRKELVMRRFEVAARVMGWDIFSPCWVKRDGTEEGAHGANGLKATIGRVRLDKHGRANRYEVIRIMNINGGEDTIHHLCSGEELVEWADGILAAAEKFAPEAVRAAWNAANEARAKAA